MTLIMSLSKDSSLYNFFNKSSDGTRVICKFCSVTLKIRPDGSACNMNRHLQLKHPGESIKHHGMDINQPSLNIERMQGVHLLQNKQKI